MYIYILYYTIFVKYYIILYYFKLYNIVFFQSKPYKRILLLHVCFLPMAGVWFTFERLYFWIHWTGNMLDHQWRTCFSEGVDTTNQTIWVQKDTYFFFQSQ